jgi:hypothetical protein
VTFPTLGHHGVLFLDELTEFRRDAVEGLRQPMEDGRVKVTRMVGAIVKRTPPGDFPSGCTVVRERGEPGARPSRLLTLQPSPL